MQGQGQGDARAQGLSLLCLFSQGNRQEDHHRECGSSGGWGSGKLGSERGREWRGGGRGPLKLIRRT